MPADHHHFLHQHTHKKNGIISRLQWHIHKNSQSIMLLCYSSHVFCGFVRYEYKLWWDALPITVRLPPSFIDVCRIVCINNYIETKTRFWYHFISMLFPNPTPILHVCLLIIHSTNTDILVTFFDSNTINQTLHQNIHKDQVYVSIIDTGCECWIRLGSGFVVVVVVSSRSNILCECCPCG